MFDSKIPKIIHGSGTYSIYSHSVSSVKYLQAHVGEKKI